MRAGIKFIGPAICALVLSLSAAPGEGQLPLEYYFPSGFPKGKIIRHTGYTLHYSEKHRQAAWAVYLLTKERAAGTAAVTETFRPDPEIFAGAVQEDDYAKTGFARGMIVPAGNLKWSKTAAAEAYFMSNVTPMKPAFLKGLWAELETYTRKWAEANGKVYIVAGPILNEDLATMGESGIAIPRRMFAVILDNSEPELKCIGFILPNEPSKKSLMSRAVSIDEVETATGLNFFPNLPDRLENTLEASADTTLWSISGNSGAGGTPSPVTFSEKGRLTGKAFTPAVLCRGKNSDGTPCKRMTTNPSGYCREHEDQAAQENK